MDDRTKLNFIFANFC